MPIPFRDQDEVDELGLAAFLRVEAEPYRAGYRGALFQVNARGEPVEFTYNRVATPASYLWRPGDIRRAALKKLAISLLATCSRTPRLLLALTEQVGSELFCEDVRVSVPVSRIATPLQTAAFSSLETPEHLSVPSPDGEPGQLHLFWVPAPPADASTERRLLRELARGGLLLEPFERAGVGLREVYGDEAAHAGPP